MNPNKPTQSNKKTDEVYDFTKDITLPDTFDSFSLDIDDTDDMVHSTPIPGARVFKAPPSPKQFQEPLPPQFFDESGLEEEYDMLVREVEGITQLNLTLKQFNDSLSYMETQLKSFHSNIQGTEEILTNWGNLLGHSILSDSLIRSEGWKGGAQDAAVEDLVGDFALPDKLSFGQI